MHVRRRRPLLISGGFDLRPPAGAATSFRAGRSYRSDQQRRSVGPSSRAWRKSLRRPRLSTWKTGEPALPQIGGSAILPGCTERLSPKAGRERFTLLLRLTAMSSRPAAAAEPLVVVPRVLPHSPMVTCPNATVPTKLPSAARR